MTVYVTKTANTVSGGIAPYTYAWSNSQTAAILTGLAGGTYSVTVTDGAGCITTGSVTIDEPAELIAAIAPTDVSCAGGSDGGNERHAVRQPLSPRRAAGLGIQR